MMLNKTTYYAKASFALLIVVFLGYVVKFYPNQLVEADSAIQGAVRGNLPQILTSFFSYVTVLGNTLTQVILVSVLTAILYFWKNWRAEAIWVLASGLSAGILIPTLKLIYARPRPSLSHLVAASGYSFPSGHATGAMLIFGSLLVIISQRMPKGWFKILVQTGLMILIVLVGLSRIYLGVHYPSDVLAGFVLGFGVLHLLYPTYMTWRFKWRFTGQSR
ncbi:phosphatase PAP2 family protein [Streptococcus entericus]|uniref:phosphatase PAP2 family protein n=1 Tax=Streptococcus entericus TaxID=155680 RepID=UPI00037675A1|nr:phosphatase PAP2 family protein [Streptococcus entericus]